MATAGRETAAVVVEPIQAEGGILVPGDDYLRNLREWCEDQQMLLDHRRGAGLHGPHRDALGARAGRHRARRDDQREGPRGRPADRRAARQVGSDALEHLRDLTERTPELRTEYERLQPRFDLIRQAVRTRKHANA